MALHQGSRLVRSKLCLLLSRVLFVFGLTLAAFDCAVIPQVAHKPQRHNHFPQLARMAVLPFFNQSDDPTLNQDQITMAYYNKLQRIPGFEVVPVGVSVWQLKLHGIRLGPGTDYQQLARRLGVDAVVVGAVTDYSAYYPPRMMLAVNWFAANSCFYPIPSG